LQKKKKKKKERKKEKEKEMRGAQIKAIAPNNISSHYTLN
jgi:hypothetical protein